MAEIKKFNPMKARESGRETLVLNHRNEEIGRLKHERGQISAFYYGQDDVSEHEDAGFSSHKEAMDWLHEKHYGIMAKKHEKLKLKEDTNMSKELLEMVEAGKPYEIRKMIDEMLRAKAAEAIDTIKEDIANGYFEPEDEEDFDDEVTEEEVREFLAIMAEESEMSIEEVLEHLSEENGMTVEEVLEEIVSHLGDYEITESKCEFKSHSNGKVTVTHPNGKKTKHASMKAARSYAAAANSKRRPQFSEGGEKE